MPKFKVIQYRDAVVRYEVEIVDCGHSEYDNADMEVQYLKGAELIPAHEVW